MKKLFFLLLVVNLVVWLWGQREQLARLTEATPPAPGTIRLLDDAQVAARREEALARAAAPLPRAGPSAAGDAVGGSAPAVAIASEPHPSIPLETRPSTPAEQAASPSAPLVVPEPVAAVPAVEPPLVAPAEPQATVRDASMGAEQLAAEERDDHAGASIAASGAEVVAGAVEAAPPALHAPTPVAEPTASVSAQASTEEVAAMPELVREEAPAPVEAIVAVPTLEPTTAQMGAGAAVEVVQPAIEKAPPGEPLAPAAASPAEPPAAITDSVALAEPTAPAIPGPSGITAPGAASAAAEPPSPPVAAREVLYLCESIGPFAERPAAVRFQSGLAAPVRGAAVREERSSRPIRHWVLAPVQPSKEATAEYLAKLSQAGVKDAWRIPNGPIAGRLAVGVFQSAENARKHADMLAAKGVAAEVLAPKDLEPIRVYWVDYERPADAAPPDPGNGKGQPARQVVTRSCGRVAGP
jgi:hypothetical protein